jgi:hypothetical protein
MINTKYLSSGKLKEMEFPFLLDSGAGTDISVDGSAVPVVFSFVAPSIFRLYSATISFSGTAVDPVASDGFLNGAAIANGCQFFVSSALGGAAVYDFFDKDNTPTTAASALENIDMFLTADAFDTNVLEFDDGAHVFNVTWNFRRNFGVKRLAAGQAIEFHVNDDLSGCLHASVMIRGEYE